MALFIKPFTVVNDFQCQITMNLLKDPYFYREWRICHTPTSLLLSGTYYGFYMVIEFPLKGACPEHNECPCVENEVEIEPYHSEFSNLATIWTYYYTDFMNDSQLKIQRGGKLMRIRIPYVFGKYIQAFSKGSFHADGIKIF